MKRVFRRVIGGRVWSADPYCNDIDTGVVGLAIMPVPGGWLARSALWKGSCFDDSDFREVFTDTLIPDPGHTDPEWRELHADYFAAQGSDASEDT